MNKKFFLADKSCRLNFAVYYPDDYRDVHLITYLHGAGERGFDISHLSRHGIPKLIEEGLEINAVVVCPQCLPDFVWDNLVEDVKAIIDRVAEEFNTDLNKICITGSSMGGFGTWMMGLSYPDFFAAIAPVAGGGMAWRTPNLRETPVYAIHGAEDSVVPPIYSELMVSTLNASGGNAKLLCLEGFGHNDGIDEAYRNTDLLQWLLSNVKSSERVHVPEFLSELF